MPDWMDEYGWQVLDTTDEGGRAIVHLKIWRHDREEICLSWSKMQALKNAAVGEDVYMIEVYPEENRVVDEVNYRHFWSSSRDKTRLFW